MKKLLLLILCAAAGVAYLQPGILTQPTAANQPAPASDQRLWQAYQNQQSDLQIQGYGEVIQLLPDDTHGSQHQRFILQLSTGQTLLVAHNIDLAPRLDGLKVGDSVEFFGEYEWNNKGGVMHWTHHDPAGRHTNGWLKHKGTTYQ
ncbi:DUF3465 domain-containing protein [Pontibacter sp. JAM-7]|uniref:DUF3465 domain-containing protein n=1 Tax=Pontibacter sp. JAM-7 TaxID=3366581 RepID=UPI003AF4D4A3